jgi:hypothetical protein
MADTSIQDFFARACQAVADGDMDFWRASLADDALVVGSAPGEVLRGRDDILNAFSAYGAIPCEANGVSGRTEATFGWAFGDVLVAGAAFRLSLVATRAEDQPWQLSHWHISVAVPDDQVFSDPPSD